MNDFDDVAGFDSFPNWICSKQQKRPVYWVQAELFPPPASSSVSWSNQSPDAGRLLWPFLILMMYCYWNDCFRSQTMAKMHLMMMTETRERIWIEMMRTGDRMLLQPQHQRWMRMDSFDPVLDSLNDDDYWKEKRMMLMVRVSNYREIAGKSSRRMPPHSHSCHFLRLWWHSNSFDPGGGVSGSQILLVHGVEVAGSDWASRRDGGIGIAVLLWIPEIQSCRCTILCLQSKWCHVQKREEKE